MEKNKWNQERKRQDVIKKIFSVYGLLNFFTAEIAIVLVVMLKLKEKVI